MSAAEASLHCNANLHARDPVARGWDQFSEARLWCVAAKDAAPARVACPAVRLLTASEPPL